MSTHIINSVKGARLAKFDRMMSLACIIPTLAV
jgi:hypothetical protein